jgi:hypothetical protein
VGPALKLEFCTWRPLSEIRQLKCNAIRTVNSQWGQTSYAGPPRTGSGPGKKKSPPPARADKVNLYSQQIMILLRTHKNICNVVRPGVPIICTPSPSRLHCYPVTTEVPRLETEYMMCGSCEVLLWHLVEGTEFM